MKKPLKDLAHIAALATMLGSCKPITETILPPKVLEINAPTSVPAGSTYNVGVRAADMGFAIPIIRAQRRGDSESIQEAQTHYAIFRFTAGSTPGADTLDLSALSPMRDLRSDTSYVVQRQRQ